MAGRRNSKRSRDVSVSRAVTSRLRSLHLGASEWVLKKKRNTDPTPYIPDPIFSRRVRLYLPSGSTQYVAIKDIVEACFPIVAVYTDQNFGKLKIRAITLYGAAASDAYIALQPAVDTANFGYNSREFSDSGVQGSKRPCVRIELPAANQRWMDSYSSEGYATKVLAYTTVGKAILDLDVSFAGANNTLDPPSELGRFSEQASSHYRD